MGSVESILVQTT